MTSLLKPALTTLCLILSLSISQISASDELPDLGDATSGYVSINQEFELGRIWLRQLRASANTINDPVAVSFIENLIYRLLPYSEVKDSRLEFVIIDQPELNAFAVPGGIIGINAGIFLYARDEDELAAVMAHELAHLSQRHFARRIEAAERQAPVAIASLLASILLIATNNPDAGFAGLVSSQAASAQSQLAYSRDWEREADRAGMRTLAASGMDPQAMPSMFQQMLAANRYNERPPEFLLTHPVTDTRISDAANRAENFQTQARTASFDFLILKHQAQLRYVIPRKERRAFFNMELENAKAGNERDALLYALSSVILADKKYAEALKTLNEISKTNADHPATSIMRTEILYQSGKEKEAIKELKAAYKLRPDSFALAIALADMTTRYGESEYSLANLKQWSNKRKADPVIWSQLFKTASAAEDSLTAYRARAEFLYLNGQKAQAEQQLEYAVEQAKKAGSFQQQAALKERLEQIRNASDSLDL